jgi:hypothetical protein
MCPAPPSLHPPLPKKTLAIRQGALNAAASAARPRPALARRGRLRACPCRALARRQGPAPACTLRRTPTQVPGCPIRRRPWCAQAEGPPHRPRAGAVARPPCEGPGGGEPRARGGPSALCVMSCEGRIAMEGGRGPGRGGVQGDAHRKKANGTRGGRVSAEAWEAQLAPAERLRAGKAPCQRAPCGARRPRCRAAPYGGARGVRKPRDHRVGRGGSRRPTPLRGAGWGEPRARGGPNFNAELCYSIVMSRRRSRAGIAAGLHQGARTAMSVSYVDRGSHLAIYE